MMMAHLHGAGKEISLVNIVDCTVNLHKNYNLFIMHRIIR